MVQPVAVRWGQAQSPLLGRLDTDRPATNPVWGVGDQAHMCPAGMALRGFASKAEDDQRGYDDTALNRIRMFCGPEPD